MNQTEKLNRIWLYAALIVFVATAVWIGSFVPNADWYATFDPAARGVLEGRSMYEQPLFSNPPWAVLILLPFVLFPLATARGLVLVAIIAIWIYIAWRLKSNWAAFVALLISPTAIGAVLASNLDAFALTGIFLPPVYGLFLLMIKPQIGFGVALYYLVQTWRESRAAGVIRAFAPIILAHIAGLILFPLWIERLRSQFSNVWNRSIFPYGIPLGIFFLWLAIRKRNVWFALASAPFFSPFLTFYTYLVVQIGLLHPDVEKLIRRDVLQIILCIFLWVIMLIYKL